MKTFKNTKGREFGYTSDFCQNLQEWRQNVINDICLIEAPTICRNKGSGSQQEQVSAMYITSLNP